MDFRTLLSAGVLALACALPGVAAAQQARPFGLDPARFGLMSLDPQVFAAVKRALTPDLLKQLGYDGFDTAAENAHVEIAPADCPGPCSSGLDRGLCLCEPDAKGACPPGAAPAQGGGPLCTALPATATLFASDGGLGTTRLRLTP